MTSLKKTKFSSLDFFKSEYEDVYENFSKPKNEIKEFVPIGTDNNQPNQRVNMTNNNKNVQTRMYNPLQVQLQTLSVEKKTPEHYITQIKNNFYVGVKAHFLISRDLFEAKSNLNESDYNSVLKQCNIASSTERKYLSIGSDVRLMKLFIQGNLPMKWTNQYLLTQLTDVQFEKVAKVIDPETTAKQIIKISNFKGEAKVANDLLSFLQLEIDKTKVDVSSFEKIVKKVKSALSSIPQITIKDERVDTVKTRINSHLVKLEKQKKEAETEQLAIERAKLIAA